MGQKVNPHGIRVGVIKDWDSRWFASKKDFSDNLVEDHKIRTELKAQLMAKENGYALVRLPSGEMRNVPVNCTAVIGQVSNIDHENVNLGKAGRKRHMGVRPGSRGTVMNPCDHPHGGGEGRAPVGHSGPMTPWGKPALGLKTRKHHKRSDKLIVKRAGK